MRLMRKVSFKTDNMQYMIIVQVYSTSSIESHSCCVDSLSICFSDFLLVYTLDAFYANGYRIPLTDSSVNDCLVQLICFGLWEVKTAFSDQSSHMTVPWACLNQLSMNVCVCVCVCVCVSVCVCVCVCVGVMMLMYNSFVMPTLYPNDQMRVYLLFVALDISIPPPF